jgi:hypothetical protein
MTIMNQVLFSAKMYLLRVSREFLHVIEAFQLISNAIVGRGLRSKYIMFFRVLFEERSKSISPVCKLVFRDWI